VETDGGSCGSAACKRKGINIAAKVEKDQQVGVRKLTQAHACQLNGSCQSSQGSPALKEVGQVGDKTAGLGDEEGVS
jgi:hypothetical protein